MRELLSERARSVKRSEIRELLKLTEQPDIISFAGGMPDPATFPVQEFSEVFPIVLKADYRKALQYGTTEGDKRFRQAVIDWLAPEGFQLNLEEIITISASQQGLDLIAKTFLDPGDLVFCDLPTYLGALQVFTSYQTEKIGIPLESDGMNVELLETRIQEAKRLGKRPKLIYLIPNFHNPTGITMSEAKRLHVLAVAEKYNLLVIEDDPYGWMRYEGRALPAIKTLEQNGRVILLVSFSKLLCPGLRLAVLAAASEIVGEIVKLKQPTDLCTSPFVQSLAYHYLAAHDLRARLGQVKEIYRQKRDVMLQSLQAYLPKHPEIRWVKPEGGFFIWVTLPIALDAAKLLKRAIEKKIAFVTGSAFYADGEGKNTLRLSFAEQKVDLIREGVRRLGRVVEEEIALLTV